MIIARITMGLGNQMFQYAAGKALALEKNVPLKVDTSAYSGYKLRKYELEEYFNITTEQATQGEIEQYRYNHPVKRVWNKIFKKHKLRILGLPYEERFVAKNLLALHDFLIPPHKRKTYTEPHYHFDKDFFQANSDIYLHGYWMSWRYFEKYDEVIRRLFTINNNLVKHVDELVDRIKKQNSVSIHIRRTDYADPFVVKLKGIIPPSFYINAIQYVGNKMSNPVFYIFSDDINWAKQNLAFNEITVHYIDETISTSAIEDFYLMTLCKHNIITNSTFSWWAAYLNNNPDKIVIAPKRWYNKAPYDYKDVCPPSWSILNS